MWIVAPALTNDLSSRKITSTSPFSTVKDLFKVIPGGGGGPPPGGICISIALLCLSACEESRRCLHLARYEVPPGRGKPLFKLVLCVATRRLNRLDKLRLNILQSHSLKRSAQSKLLSGNIDVARITMASNLRVDAIKALLCSHQRGDANDRLNSVIAQYDPCLWEVLRGRSSTERIILTNHLNLHDSQLLVNVMLLAHNRPNYRRNKEI